MFRKTDESKVLIMNNLTGYPAFLNKHKFVQKVAKRIIILIYFIFSANINFVQ